MSISLISVIGESKPSEELYRLAERLGALLADAGYGVCCGGLSGIMEAVCRGAKSRGGVTVGLLPMNDSRDANPYVDIAIPTGIGLARNTLVARAGEAIIAVGGRYGTLSEIAFGLNVGKTVIGLRTWGLQPPHAMPEGIIHVVEPEEAVALLPPCQDKTAAKKPS